MRGAVRGLFSAVALIAAAAVAVPVVSGTRDQGVDPSSDPTRPALLPRMPFIENGGQLDNRAAFVAPGAEGSAFFTPDGMRLRLGTGSSTWNLAQELIGARSVVPVGADPASTTVSYFHGGPSEWHTDLNTFDRVVYRESWPGIDVAYTRTSGRLKYRFIVHPGADPSSIAFRWAGASGLHLDQGGGLQIEMGDRSLTDAAPVSYQLGRGRRSPVPTEYLLRGGDIVGFEVGRHDPTRRLVIDPALILYAGFIGGSGNDSARAIAVDEAGSAYLAGRTGSMTGFPAVVGPDSSYNGDVVDAFVAKVNPAGTALEYAGFIGGDEEDEAGDVAVDATGSAYVVGRTRIGNGFPATVGPDTSHNGVFDAFIAKVNPAGTALEYAGFIGGPNGESGTGVAIDPAGAAYVSGRAESGFPPVVGPDTTLGGTFDTFITKVAPGGASVVYSGFVGGDDAEAGGAVAVDDLGRAHVVGTTSSQTGFPVTVGPDSSHGGMGDGFIARVNPAGTGFEYAGFIGGSENDSANAVVVGQEGTAFVTGSTGSGSDFPVVAGPDSSYNGGFSDAFVARVSVAGDGFLLSGFVGGAESDGGAGIALSPSGTIHIGGVTESATFTRTGRRARGFSDSQRVFAARLEPGGTGLADVTFISGGGGEDVGVTAVDRAGNQYLAGTSKSVGGFGVATGPDTSYNGGFEDGFVAKLQTHETCQGKPVSLLGTPGKDKLKGTAKADVIAAGDGNDTVSAKGGKDRVCGGKGNDKLKGGGGNDRLNGEKGNDDLNAGGGKGDRCKGGPGKDDGKACEKGKV